MDPEETSPFELSHYLERMESGLTGKINKEIQGELPMEKTKFDSLNEAAISELEYSLQVSISELDSEQIDEITKVFRFMDNSHHRYMRIFDVFLDVEDKSSYEMLVKIAKILGIPVNF